MKQTVQIDGQKIFNWIQKCDDTDRSLLVGSEFSNDFDEWVVKSVDRDWVAMTSADGTYVRKRLQFIIEGAFFVDISLAEQLEESRRAILSPEELALESAKEALQSRGFHLVALSASDTKYLSSVVVEFQDKSCPDVQDWALLQDIVLNGTVENMRVISPLLKIWIERSERKLGLYDLSRRILLATVYRHTGQLQKAVEVSNVVNEHGKYPNDQGCIAILCTTRAATLMDIAESSSSSPCETLALARKSLNRANAIRSSEEVMATYMRMKMLDQRFGCP